MIVSTRRNTRDAVAGRGDQEREHGEAADRLERRDDRQGQHDQQDEMVSAGETEQARLHLVEGPDDECQ
ncbi:MAG: hypothetical protein R2697_03060 [Ilumatobacteraceae bacterium]